MIKTISITIYLLFICISSAFASLDEVDQVQVIQPTLGPVLGLPEDNVVRFWWRGPVLDDAAENHNFYGVLSINNKEQNKRVFRAVKLETYFDEDGSKPVKDLIAYCDVILVPGIYKYRCGYISGPNEPQDSVLDWSSIEKYTLQFQPETINPAIGFGSCRFFAKLWCFKPWLNKSDRIFAPLNEKQVTTQRLDAFFFLGDFIYADSFRCLNHAVSYQDFKKLYELAMSTANFRRMLATVPSSFMMDDHELRNNFTETYKQDHPNIYKSALLAYGTYQYMLNPRFNTELSLPIGGFEISVRGVPGYVLDTRNERTSNPRCIISVNEMDRVKDWLTKNKKNNPMYTLLFTGVTMAPAFIDGCADNLDIWAGYPEQTQELLGHIDEAKYSGLIFCAGDRHSSDYVQFETPVTKTIVTSITSSPLFWPLGLGAWGLQPLQTEEDVQEFIPGYKYVKASREYQDNNYGRIEFLGDDKIQIQFIGTDGGWINENDPAGHTLDLKAINSEQIVEDHDSEK